MENLVGKEFIRLSKYDHLEPSAQSLGIPQPPLELEAPKDALLINLPPVDSIKTPSIDLRQAIEQRVSSRDYAFTPLSIQELAYLLWCTQGVKQTSARQFTKRNVPSAGARHAFETWLLINRVEELDAGLYRYLALSHKLVKLQAPINICDLLTEACKHQKHVHNSAVSFFWVAVTERMIWRYCQRGYRYMFLDAGHVCQNLYLAAEQIGCRVCAIAAYDDDMVNQTLGLDGENLFTIYIASLGKKK